MAGDWTDAVKEIETRWDFSELLEETGVETAPNSRYRRNVSIRCPWHDDTNPSCDVSRERGVFICSPCGARGTPWQLLEKLTGKAFPELVRELADRYGVALPEKDASVSPRQRDQRTLKTYMEWAQEQLHGPEGAIARDYLSQRGVAPEVAREFGLGYAPRKPVLPLAPGGSLSWEDLTAAGLVYEREGAQRRWFVNRVIFPVMLGKMIADLTARTLDPPPPKWLNAEETEKNPAFGQYRKYLNLPRRQKVPLGLNVLSAETQGVALVEGPLDWLLSTHYGQTTIARRGLDSQQVAAYLDVLPDASYVILVDDGDVLVGDAAKVEAAVRRITQQADLFLRRGIPVQLLQLPPEEDPASLLARVANEGNAHRWPEYVLQKSVHFACWAAGRLDPQVLKNPMQSRAVLLPLLRQLRWLDPLCAHDVLQGLSEKTGLPTSVLHATYCQLRQQTESKPPRPR